MVNFNLAHTSRINPPGAAPVLTQPQLWAGLQRKIRFAQEFVPVIESCTVLEESADGVVTRHVVFKKGMGPKDTAREVVRGFWPTWVDFEQEDGSHVRNIISDGASGGVEDLHMTYVFEFRLPNVQEGTEEAEKELARLKGMAKKAVDSSIDAIREMVKDGRIKE
ncbi:hypothetical protein COCMIDRAFT_4118 [Bipolaris oryzae ATCC 44560]|uniref:DUF1857-domain-containing protein n=1 Tax=Bipolaris oryzae ATCC 44560 TaxID=930090 RepID=W6ZHD1_COCMI|nr:uncharacterized protein COCMIDRAFT_4118 [Bipolaris oryzae ATCC 44560]EUC46829.1 hypothetical protein COCMIDRAFT_4118 [Bipolaris oryzae ATCC 44560]